MWEEASPAIKTGVPQRVDPRPRACGDRTGVASGLVAIRCRVLASTTGTGTIRGTIQTEGAPVAPAGSWVLEGGSVWWRGYVGDAGGCLRQRMGVRRHVRGVSPSKAVWLLWWVVLVVAGMGPVCGHVLQGVSLSGTAVVCGTYLD